jgi:hypothetical protein
VGLCRKFIGIIEIRKNIEIKNLGRAGENKAVISQNKAVFKGVLGC